MKVLEDGNSHTKAELWACLNDEQSNKKALSVHLCLMRRVLRPRGEDVVWQHINGISSYRWVRLIAS